jgi:hypothetical protein
MTAPLPLRFYNPVKGLCEKVNLDYETVIGTGLSAKMREVYLYADIPKELKDINTKDRNQVQHKIAAMNRKYGAESRIETNTTEGEVQDKGRIRYDAELIVESVCPDDSEVVQSTPIRHGLENSKPIKSRNDMLWCPGRGIIPRNELGLD